MSPMDPHDLYDSTLKGALGCRAVWPPVLTPTLLGDYGVVDGGVFRRLGNVAEFATPFTTTRGQPSRLDLSTSDVRLTRFAGGVQVPSLAGLGDVSARVRIEFGRSDGFVLKCARVELEEIADLGVLARRLLAARAPDGQRWRPLAWRLVWQRYTGHDVFFFAARSAGSHVELDGSATLLHGIDAAAGSAGLSRHRAAGLGLEIVGDSGPIGLGLARVKLVGGVKFFSDDPDSASDDEFVERLPPGADAAPDADEP